MVDKELFERIADASCSIGELADFCADLDEREFDRDDSFRKYYRLERILSAIEKCERGEIDIDYLMTWAIAYNWIVMATKWANIEGTGLTGFEDYLIEEISQTLDSLSFFDGMVKKEEQAEQLESYKESFRLFDLFLSTVGEWTVSYAVGVTRDGPADVMPEEDDGYEENEEYDEDDEEFFFEEEDDLHGSFLAVNESKKLFEQFFSWGFSFNEKKMKERKITPEEMAERVAALQEAGYKEPSV